jgi:hypothetical protein
VPRVGRLRDDLLLACALSHSSDRL